MQSALPPHANAKPLTTAARRSSELVQRAIGLVVSAVGLLVLSGWLFELPAIRQLRPGWASMKPDTALGFVLLGVSLWAACARGPRRIVSRVCAAGVAALALVTLAEYLFDQPIGINRFFWEIRPDGGATAAGRMAITTALGFAFTSAALRLLCPRRRTGAFVPQLLALAAGFIAFVGLLVYTYDVRAVYGHPATSMAVHTALLFLLVTVGMLAADPDDGIVALVRSSGPGGVILRRFGILVVTVPFALGWLRDLGQRAGLYSGEVGTLWLVAAFGLFGLAWVASTAWTLDRDARRIRESEAKYRTLADAVPQMTWILDHDGVVSYFNRRWYEYTGMAPDEGAERSWLQHIHPDDREGVLRVRVRAIAAGEPWELEARLRRRDGVYRWHLNRVVPLRDASGAIVAWYGAALDIDDRRRAEDALRRLGDAREQVIAVVSHDLKNPLHTILLTTTLLRARLRSGGDPAAAEAKVEVIRRAAERMQQLTQDLLDVAKIEAGRLTLERRPEAPGALVGEAIELLRPQAEEKALELRVIDEPVGPVSCDRHRVLQVLSNLIGNAIKFTPSGGRVTVGVRSEGGGALFSVADTGPGIPPAHLSSIFDRFWQARETASAGTGLGLSIAKGIVDAHGGRIWAESEPGRGATFRVWLPSA